MFDKDFGNKEIAGLKEISLPDPIPYLPQTIGWYILFTVVLILALWLGYRGYHRWMANRYRTLALRQLDDIEQQLRQPDTRMNALTAIPVLIKQTALKCYRRAEIAQMSGKEWLAFLDKSYGGNEFTDGPGVLLPGISYGSQKVFDRIEDEEINRTVLLVRKWIGKHGVME
jgi:hypothetical protein